MRGGGYEEKRRQRDGYNMLVDWILGFYDIVYNSLKLDPIYISIAYPVDLDSTIRYLRSRLTRRKYIMCCMYYVLPTPH